MNQLLDVDALVRSSRAQVPEGDFGDESFIEPLRVFVEALEREARLQGTGQWAAAARIIAALNRRRRLHALVERTPELVEVPVEAPVFILGFPRTGTTLLHNLFASDPANRALRLWEMREPFAPADAGPDWAAQVQATTAQLVEAGYRLSPRLAAIHPLDPMWPDECSWLFRNSFATQVLGFSYFVPSYLRYLDARDARPDYRYFKLQLQGILAQRPGQPLVLKDPCHIWNLDALLETFPDARVIYLHRAIEQVLPSFCSLCRALQEGGAEARPDAAIGRYATQMLATAMDRALAVRSRLESDRILDLDYRRLVAAPLDSVAGLYDQLGLDYTPAAREAMADWLEANRGLSGKHRYSLEMFGLDPDEVASRFAAYTDRFASLLAN